MRVRDNDNSSSCRHSRAGGNPWTPNEQDGIQTFSSFLTTSMFMDSRLRGNDGKLGGATLNSRIEILRIIWPSLSVIPNLIWNPANKRAW
jgi:hypothetical protein